MPNYNIEELFPGQSYSLTFRAETSSGIPINLSGYNIYSSIRERFSSSTGISSFNSNIVTPSSGVCTISLTSLQTSGLAAGVYIYSVYTKNSSTLDSIPLLDGYLPINPFPAF